MSSVCSRPWCFRRSPSWGADVLCFFFFSSRRRHTRCSRDWSSDVCSSDLYLHSRRGAPQALTDTGGVACANGKEVAQRSDVIIAMVPDTPHVQDVLFGANGEIGRASCGKECRSRWSPYH